MHAGLESGVPPVVAVGRRHQFTVRSLFPNLSCLQEVDSVGVSDGRKAVRDDDDQSVLGGFVQRIHQIGFRLRVERGSRLVENQNGRIPQEPAGDGDALLLSYDSLLVTVPTLVS